MQPGNICKIDLHRQPDVKHLEDLGLWILDMPQKKGKGAGWARKKHIRAERQCLEGRLASSSKA